MKIKFRGKRIDGSRWVYGFYYQKPSGKHYIYNCVTRLHYEVDPETVGQYTGRKDKNDREIYSGNRLRITIYDFWTEHEIAQEESIVEFGNCKFGVVWRGMFSGLDGFGRNVRFEVIDEEV